MRERRVGPIAHSAQRQPGAGERHRRDGERIGAQRQRRNAGADAPGDDGIRFVAAHVIHLADQGDRAAESGGSNDVERFADRIVVARLQDGAADIAGQNGRKQRGDAADARNGFPIGGDQHEDRRAEQQCGHHRQHRAEAQRFALALLDVARQGFGKRCRDQPLLDPARNVLLHADGISGHSVSPNEPTARQLEYCRLTY